MYLLPLHHPDEPAPPDSGWKFFIVCKDKDGNQSNFIDQIEALGENRSGDFYAMLLHLTRLAGQGKPWQDVFPDKRRMHYVGEFTLKHTNGRNEQEKVWEFKHGDIRILWCYGGKGKIILFGGTLVKDQKKIDPSNIMQVGKAKNEYQAALENGRIKIAGGEENERAFGKYFSES